jgi:CHASE1-domain containing sensor protein
MNDDSQTAPGLLGKISSGSLAGDGSSAHTRRIAEILAPFVLGTALTIGWFVVSSEQVRRDKSLRLEGIASTMAAALNSNFELQFETLNSLPAFFVASDDVTRSDFGIFVRRAMRRFPSIYAFQWLPRVEAADRAAFEARLRVDGIGGNGIREIIDSQNAQPAADRAEYFPVLYGEPGVQFVFGLDLASHPEQGPYYRRACVSDGTVATLPLSLIEDPPDVLSVIVINAVRFEGTRSDQSCDGLAMMILRVNRVVTQAIGEERLRQFEVSITTENTTSEPRAVFRSLSARANNERRIDWPSATREIKVSDQHWILDVTPVPDSPLSPGGSSWLVLPVGLLLSALLSYGVHAWLAITRLHRRVDAALELGQYNLGRQLGEGGMGTVYEATHRMLARPVAIKLIRTDGAANSQGPGGIRHELVARFEKEAQATSKLESPHTIRVYDFGQTESGVFYYVMELLNGLDLESLVTRYGTVSPGRCIHFLRQACASIHEAHLSGLVHRDIKPANIFACRHALEYDFVKVLDFGLVKSTREEDATPAITRAGNVMGTPAFAAPEAILNERAEPRSDVYSLGCVGYWLLCGEHVFPTESAAEALVRHVNDAPPVPSNRSQVEIPTDVEDIILRCLAKDPDKRPESAEELARLLGACRDAGTWGKVEAAQWWAAHAEASSPPVS